MTVAFVGAEPLDLGSFPDLDGIPPKVAYPYTDENGQLLFAAVRYEPGPNGETKTFRQFRPGAGGKWIANVKDVRLVPYRLPQVLAFIASNSREPLYICEGEKDADAIVRLGHCATTNPMGAGKWKDEFSELLAGTRSAVVVGDRDEVGIAHANAVKASLATTVGVTADLLLPKDGKDLTEHLHAGYGMDDLVPLYDEPEPDPGAIVILPAGTFLALDEASLEPLMGTESQAVLTAGGLLILGGEAGTAKTTLTLDVIAHIGSGTPWQGIPQQRAIRIAMIENEGPRGKFKEKLQEKVDAWDGPDFLSNLYVFTAPWGRFTLADEAFRQNLYEFTQKHAIDLVVADPLGSLGVEGVGAPDETRRFIAILKGMGLFDPAMPCAYWFPHHYSKQHVGGSVISQLSGDWGGHADTVVGIKNEGKSKSIMTWAKVRWSDELHGETWTLEWAAGGSYTRHEHAPEEKVNDGDLWDRILDYLKEQDKGVPPSRIAKDVKGNQQRIRDLVKQAGADGRLVNEGTVTRPLWRWQEGGDGQGGFFDDL